MEIVIIIILASCCFVLLSRNIDKTIEINKLKKQAESEISLLKYIEKTNEVDQMKKQADNEASLLKSINEYQWIKYVPMPIDEWNQRYNQGQIRVTALDPEIAWWYSSRKFDVSPMWDYDESKAKLLSFRITPKGETQWDYQNEFYVDASWETIFSSMDHHQSIISMG